MSAIYNFCTPSDPITFRAPSDLIATAVGLIVGNAHAFTENCDTGAKLETCFLFGGFEEREKEIFGEGGLVKFIDDHREDIISSLDSFLYGSPQRRLIHEKTLSLLESPEKVAEWKKVHEDKDRSSMTRWVDYAWRLARGIREKMESEARA